MNKRSQILLLVGIPVVLALAVWGWQSLAKGTPTAAQPTPKLAMVQVTAVREGTLARTLEVTGTVSARAEIAVMPKIEQPIRAMLVQEGDRVTAGQVLVRLESTELDAQLATAVAERRVAEATVRDLQAGARPQEIAQAQAAFRQADAAYQRALAAERNARALYAGKETGVPVQAIEDAQGKVAVVTAQREAAQAALTAAEDNLRQVRALTKLNTTQQQAVNEANGKVETATAQVEAATVTVDNANAEHERAQALLKIGGIAQEDTDRAQTRFKTAQAQLQTAKSTLATAQEGYRLAKSLLDTNAVPQQQLADAQGRVDVARAQLAAATAAVDAATRALAQVNALQGGPLPQRELDEAAGRVAETKAAMESARERVALLQAGATPTQLAVAQSRVDQAQAKIAYTQTQRALCTITAPISGVITKRWKMVGDKADPKLPLLSIAQAGRQLVKTSVSDREVAGIHAGMAARIIVDALPDMPLDVKVTNVYPGADPATRLVPVELLLPTLPRPLPEGSFARVTIRTGAQRGIVVPSAAIIPQAEGKSAVFVVTPEHTASRRMVVTDIEADGKVLVVSGLEAGARVIMKGQDAVRDGQPVKEMPKKPGNAAGPGMPAGLTPGEVSETPAVRTEGAGPVQKGPAVGATRDHPPSARETPASGRGQGKGSNAPQTEPARTEGSPR